MGHFPLNINILQLYHNRKVRSISAGAHNADDIGYRSDNNPYRNSDKRKEPVRKTKPKTNEGSKINPRIISRKSGGKH
jgi:hypothetical protein